MLKPPALPSPTCTPPWRLRASEAATITVDYLNTSIVRNTINPRLSNPVYILSMVFEQDPEPSWLGDFFRNCLPWRRRTRSNPKPVLPEPRTHLSITDSQPYPKTSVPMTTAMPMINGHNKGIAQDVWKLLSVTLQKLESSLDIFPPLKEAISGLLGCVTHVELLQTNQEGYKQLALDLKALAESLQAHLPTSRPTRMPFSISNVARLINEQVCRLKQLQTRHATVGFVMVKEHSQNIIDCYHRIEALFRQLQVDISLSVWTLTHEQWVDARLKELAPAHDAYYNSALPVGILRHGCTENTRRGVLSEVGNWTRRLNSEMIYWMNGMAGTGKTTIAYSLCEQLELNKQLAASFFCSRDSPDCRDVNRIIPSIAYQLGRYSNPYQAALCEVLGNEPDVARRRVDIQFKKLIAEPLKKIMAAIPPNVVVVIDALDECADTTGTEQVLDLIFRYAPELPIKFFVTSRPEPAIAGKMLEKEAGSRAILHLHDIEESLVQEDIRTYLATALAPIHLSSEHLERLVDRAGCLFIFAATVVRFISPNDSSADHDGRLSIVLETSPKASGKDYAEIDELYSTILSRAFDGKIPESERNLRQLVLWIVACAREPLTVPTLAEILDIDEARKVELAIQPLRSVLHVSLANGVVSMLHASFPDFLHNPTRAGRFECTATQHHDYLTARCFSLMAKRLKFNICGLETSYQADADVPDLEDRLNQAISPGLFYACRYWVDHLSRAGTVLEFVPPLHDFLQHRLLFWMEALNLKGNIALGESLLTQALVWLPKNNEQRELRQFLYDARNFITTFATSRASCSTPHIYISMLPFTPKKSHIWSSYWPRTHGLLEIEGKVMESRERAALATWSVGSGVGSISRSGDGKRIVSGCYDGTVRIWDVSKGACTVEPLSEHRGPVWSVAFSFDGARIASGSEDQTIIIWDAHAGTPVGTPICGHEGGVASLSFSPDDAYIVSGSGDQTLRLWDACTGAPLGEKFIGHKAYIMSVVFSPDGERIASGSDDQTVRVWDPETGKTIAGPFIGHTDWVDSISFSPDGRHIASSSRDRTIRVWDSYSGELVAGPFEGHTERVRTVAFSPDGMQLVSGSYDYAIRLWDAYTGKLLAGPFEGHNNVVMSVLFSTDGTRVFSGSHDGTICVWDARHGMMATAGTSGHTGAITSVAFSPKGAYIASGSTDRTVCVWDANEGTLVVDPFTGHGDKIHSVAFSPDGALIVSGSADCTLRIWAIHTGALLVGPLEGHTNAIQSVAFSADGGRIASGSNDNTIRIWDPRTGESVAEPLRGHVHSVMSVAFSPNAAHIVSGSRDKKVCMWNADDGGSSIWTSKAHADEVNCVAFSPDGLLVVSGSDDGVVLVMNAHNGQLHRSFTGHTGLIWSVTFSPDGTSVVSGSSDQTIRMWDMDSGTAISGPIGGHSHTIYSLAFSPNGARLISGSEDGTIRAWKPLSITNSSLVAMGGPFNSDGWLTDSEGGLQLWVPSDLRKVFPRRTSPLVICSAGSIRIDSGDLLMGERWHECYYDSLDTDT